MKIAAAIDTAVHWVELNPKTTLAILAAVIVLGVLFLKLIDDWKSLSWRIHAALASLFWGAVAGLLLVWPALMNVVTWPVFVGGGVILSAALAAAKYFHRPGTN